MQTPSIPRSMIGCLQRWIRFFLIALIPWSSSQASYSDGAAQARPSETGGPEKQTSTFMVGAARRDITPVRPVPMWGYGGRHDQLSQGVIDRLEAKAVVIQAGPAKVAIVGMDLGRGPTPAMMAQIRQSVAAQGIGHVLICGSHTHHGPVIELTAEEGFGKGKFDDAVAYARELPSLIVAAIIEADKNRQPAKMGVASRDVGLNRNRHSKRLDKATDPRLTLMRFDHLDGSPIAVLVHYTAHPVLTSEKVLSFSADYPGYLKARVEASLKAPCVFIQGAAGDQSASPPDGKRDPRSYGELLADEAISLARAVSTASPKRPSLAASIDRFSFTTRVNFKSSITFVLYARSFFPELRAQFLSRVRARDEPRAHDSRAQWRAGHRRCSR